MRTKPLLPPFDSEQLSSSCSINSTNCTGKTISQFKWATYYQRFVSNELPSYDFFCRCCGKKHSSPHFFLCFSLARLQFCCKFIHYIYIYIGCCCLVTNMAWMNWRWALVFVVIYSIYWAAHYQLIASYSMKRHKNKSGSVRL